MGLEVHEGHEGVGEVLHEVLLVGLDVGQAATVVDADDAVVVDGDGERLAVVHPGVVVAGTGVVRGLGEDDAAGREGGYARKGAVGALVERVGEGDAEVSAGGLVVGHRLEGLVLRMERDSCMDWRVSASKYWLRSSKATAIRWLEKVGSSPQRM